MKRKLLSLVMALLLCASSVLCASADAYIPSDPYYDILSAHESNGTCSVLNTFLSNFVETGMTHYTQNSPASVVYETVLKHLEVNAQSFSDVKKVNGDDGRTYMKVSEKFFRQRMERLFGQDLPVSNCPGYEDGSILVTASHYGGPIQVFASVYDCEWEYDDVYRVWFDAYLVEEDFSGWYRTTHYELPEEKLSLLGRGEALVTYYGGESVSSISTADFRLVEYSLQLEEPVPCAGANLPYGVEETEPPTETPTEEPAEAPTAAQTEPETKPQTAPETQPETKPLPTPSVDVQEKDSSSGTGSGMLIIIIVLVLVIAVLSLVIILLVFKKK